MENLTVLGLPAHPLLVHGVVVGVPVMALVAVVMVWRGSWRQAWAWPVAVVDVLLFALTLTSMATGEGLQEALGGQVAAEHAEYGEVAPWFAGAMAAAAVGFAVVRRRGRLVCSVAAGVLVAASLAATVWIVLTGHSGAESTWGFVEIG